MWMFFLRKNYWIFLFLLLTACTKDPVLIEGNLAPPDPTIETAVLENYINKLYISMLGREPSSSEFDSAKNILGDQATSQSRNQLIDVVHNNEEYYDNLFDIYRNDYLNGSDTTDIREQYIEVYATLIENETNSFLLEIYEQEHERLLNLYKVGEELKNGKINTIQAQKRCVDNLVYDDINMGTENYVISVFQHFLHRYPTQDELARATLMVDGDQANCFGENGDSKSDFNTLFFDHYGYYEGVVIVAYLKLLFREPTSAEASALSIQFRNNQDYKSLQKELLSSDEFLGIQ